MAKRKRQVVWRLREVMAERGLYMTTAIVPLLKAHGIDLSREQIYRIATGLPQRLSLDLLGALCAVLDCTPNDLIQFKEMPSRRRVAGDGEYDPLPLDEIRPVEAKIVRPTFED